MDTVSILIKRIAILESRVRTLENQLRLVKGQLNPIGFIGKRDNLPKGK
jgi:hypothetical protein